MSKGRGDGGGRDSNGSSSCGLARLSKDQCKHCFKFGHSSRECKNIPKKEATNVGQEGEEALMVVRAMLSPSLSPTQMVASSKEGSDAVDGRL
jgi:hypothetical protein